MRFDRFSPASLLKLAIAEGEGLGTAYEYHAKLKLIRRILNKKKIRTMLIFGLPEKYGFSLDFLLLARLKHVNSIEIIDERYEKIDTYKRLISRFGFRVKDIKRVKSLLSMKKDYDLIISSEVAQRLDWEKRQIYFGLIRKHSKTGIVFAPNGHNSSHTRFSGLKGLKTRRDYACGFIDAPPFPPGVSLKKKHRKSLPPWLIYLFYLFESILPRFTKKRLGHIIYFIS